MGKVSVASAFPLAQHYRSGAGLGSIGHKAMRCRFTDGVVRPKSEKHSFFTINCAIMLPTRPFGYKKRNLPGVKLGKRDPKNYFGTEAARVAA